MNATPRWSGGKLSVATGKNSAQSAKGLRHLWSVADPEEVDAFRTMRLRSVPSRSMVISTTSPTCNRAVGAGTPVAMMSPGWRVIIFERSDTIAGILCRMYFVCAFGIGNTWPFSLASMARLFGSGTSRPASPASAPILATQWKRECSGASGGRSTASGTNYIRRHTQTCFDKKPNALLIYGSSTKSSLRYFRLQLLSGGRQSNRSRSCTLRQSAS